MKVIEAQNVNDAFSQAIELLKLEPTLNTRTAREEDKTYEYPVPVTTVYENPYQNVLFDAVRDCNPFFHLMEFVWMLAGRQDVAWISQFNKNMETYSDNGVDFHGAYGYRWRKWHWGTYSYIDQLQGIITELKENPESRRAVSAMWDPERDLNRISKDIPCNTHVYFKIRNHALHATVCCRSNDVIWGCYGANVVQFSMLQVLLAGALGYAVGTLTQISDSWHVYPSNPRYKEIFEAQHPDIQPYRAVNTPPGSLLLLPEGHAGDDHLKNYLHILSEVSMFVNGKISTDELMHPFLKDLVVPMYSVWKAYKQQDVEVALMLCDNIVPQDWQMAAREWLGRRA